MARGTVVLRDTKEGHGKMFTHLGSILFYKNLWKEGLDK